MNKYEAMIIVKAGLSEEEKKSLFSQIQEGVTKNNGSVSTGSVWLERKKLFTPIKRNNEGQYYLLNFSAPGVDIKEITRAYRLNESILRVLITRIES